MWPAGQAPQIVVSVSRELHQSELMPFQPGTNELGTYISTLFVVKRNTIL